MFVELRLFIWFWFLDLVKEPLLPLFSFHPSSCIEDPLTFPDFRNFVFPFQEI